MIFNFKSTTALFLVTASALQQTGVSAESKFLRSRVLDSSYGSTESGKTKFSPKEIAAAWNRYANGRYAEDCPHAMAIALGEGINLSDPLNYICDPAHPDCPTTKTGCLGSSEWCWSCITKDSGKPCTVDEFLDAPVFDINQKPEDGQDTLGPWQTMTTKPYTEDINVRIGEAVDYVTNTCKCSGTQEGSTCSSEPHHLNLPVTTIFSDPAHLNWCGCAATDTPSPGMQTIGYSGRCSQGEADFYTMYQDIATQICERA